MTIKIIVESKFRSMDSKRMWEGLKSLIGLKFTQLTVSLDKGKEQEYIEELNYVYACLDSKINRAFDGLPNIYKNLKLTL